MSLTHFGTQAAGRSRSKSSGKAPDVMQSEGTTGTDNDGSLRSHYRILVAGFDGVMRVIGMLYQRRYAVRWIRVEPAGAENWIVYVTVDTIPYDGSTNLLIKRLNRIPSTLKVHSPGPKVISSIWD